MFRYSFISCAIIFASIWSIECITENEQKKFHEEILPMLSECSSKFGYNAEEIISAMKSGKNEDLDPCFMACFYKKLEVMNDKGLFDVEKSIESAKKLVSSADDTKNIEETATTCASVNEKTVSDGEKGCERAKLLEECFRKHEHLFKVNA